MEAYLSSSSIMKISYKKKSITNIYKSRYSTHFYASFLWHFLCVSICGIVYIGLHVPLTCRSLVRVPIYGPQCASVC